MSSGAIQEANVGWNRISKVESGSNAVRQVVGCGENRSQSLSEVVGTWNFTLTEMESHSRVLSSDMI